MSAIAAESSIDSHPIEPTAPPAASQQPRSLSEAIAAVTEYHLQLEMRRVRLAHAARARANAGITVPRAALDAMQEHLSRTGTQQRAFDDSLLLLAFGAVPPHAVHEVPAGRPAGGGDDQPVRGRPLAHCFAAGDAVRLQRALLAQDGEHTLIVEWHPLGRGGQRHVLHLLPPDAAQPGTRWACLLRLPHDALAAERATRGAQVKPTQRPRLGAWPLQSL
jgi:hypothetical protein